jgi:Fasciclin domain
MKKLNFTTKFASAMMLAALFILSSCNKDLETITGSTPGTPTIAATGNIAATIAANPDDSLFYRMLVRSTLLPLLADSSKRFTINAVNNAGMKIFVNAASGGAVPLAAPDAAFSSFISNNLPIANAAAIVQYNIVGQQLPTSLIPTRFPNVPYPTLIQLDPVNTPFLRMTTTYAKSSAGNINYVNNIPSFGQNDQLATNGVIHHTYTVVAPPSAIMLSNLIASKPNLTYFQMALNRADSGQVLTTTSSFNYLMSYPVLNQTVLAPSDAAFQTFIQTIVFGKALQAGATPAQAGAAAAAAVAAGPAFLMTNNVSTAQVRGIVAYHLLASDITGSISPNIRVFSVNVPTAPALVKTLVNGSAATHPGVRAVATFAGPATTSVTVTGFAALTGGAPFSDTPANVVEKDLNVINGILHVIDRVLVPLPL